MRRLSVGNPRQAQRGAVREPDQRAEREACRIAQEGGAELAEQPVIARLIDGGAGNPLEWRQGVSGIAWIVSPTSLKTIAAAPFARSIGRPNLTSDRSTHSTPGGFSHCS